MAANSTMPDLGKPQSQARAWFEPLLVVTIMVVSLIINRDRNFHIIPSPDSSSESLIKSGAYEETASRSSSRSTSPDGRPKPSMDLSQSPFVSQSDSDMNFLSRILQRFPFLVEMFYWALNFLAYAMTKSIGAALYSRNENNEITELAQQHGIDILTIEHNTMFKIFFPISEVEFQQFFLNGHLQIMTLYNQFYSLVHIPGTVAFLSWWYYMAPSHDHFALARRTMTLGNFSAFMIFSFWPCMPPRLLPESFGFRDTVRQDHAESVWVGGANVNQLAAMPSLHFTYAFIIGCTFLWHSGVLSMFRGRRTGKSPIFTFIWIVAGILYPILVLSIIVATANHYYMDAVVATFSVGLSFLLNKIWFVLLPAEALLLRILRLRKPIPSTAQNSRRRQDKPIVVVEDWA
ncbi:Putative inositolphosphotransferase Aur1/Ipt1 [Septoria linicola]|uniref:Inositolphosphotransferase Aur1/Ipt1 n=1 Tax=Septoria linicola TaxID=215465 RepID=A0A9Q9AK93_9PEZI|nr:putative inositolphosphotransferase Aur1/Ipt1 [Septoria linicola]USW50570.1 Putative inositolphosphotransferase Aur1/Ipt1 [Septoria linicola]